MKLNGGVDLKKPKQSFLLNLQKKFFCREDWQWAIVIILWFVIYTIGLWFIEKEKVFAFASFITTISLGLWAFTGYYHNKQRRIYKDNIRSLHKLMRKAKMDKILTTEYDDRNIQYLSLANDSIQLCEGGDNDISEFLFSMKVRESVNSLETFIDVIEFEQDLRSDIGPRTIDYRKAIELLDLAKTPKNMHEIPYPDPDDVEEDLKIRVQFFLRRVFVSSLIFFYNSPLKKFSIYGILLGIDLTLCYIFIS